MIFECPLAFYQSAGYVLFAFQLTARAKVGAKVGAKRFASIVMGRAPDKVLHMGISQN